MAETIHGKQIDSDPAAVSLRGSLAGGLAMADSVWRIWILDQNAESRAETRRVLLGGSSRRYCFRELETGGDCLRAWRAPGALPPTCLLLGDRPPDLDADALLSALGGADGIPFAVVVLNGVGGQDQGPALIRAGAQDLIDQDGLTPAGLTRTVENAVERHALVRARAAAEASLRFSELRLRTLVEASADAIGLIGPRGFLECNPATLRLYGCSNAEEFLGRDPMDFSPPTQPGGGDSRTLAEAHIAAAFRDGSHRFEWRHRRLDGTEFDIDLLLTRIDLPDGPVLQAIARDITGRKRLEDSLRRSELRLRTLFDASADAIAISGTDHRFAECNHSVREPVWMRRRAGFARQGAAGILTTDPARWRRFADADRGVRRQRLSGRQLPLRMAPSPSRWQYIRRRYLARPHRLARRTGAAGDRARHQRTPGPAG